MPTKWFEFQLPPTSDSMVTTGLEVPKHLECPILATSAVGQRRTTLCPLPQESPLGEDSVLGLICNPVTVQGRLT